MALFFLSRGKKGKTAATAVLSPSWGQFQRTSQRHLLSDREGRTCLLLTTHLCYEVPAIQAFSVAKLPAFPLAPAIAVAGEDLVRGDDVGSRVIGRLVGL